MRIVFAGTPDPAVPSLERLIRSTRHEVIAVVTRPDAVAGRGRKVVRSPIGELADAHGIEVLTPARPSDPEFVERLTALEPDCCPVVAYGALLPQNVLDVPKHGWVNLHFSLLPAWRGAAPVQAAIAAGDEMTGASAFRLDAGMDTGPVFGVVTERIRPTDTAGDLLGRLAEGGAVLLDSVLDGLEHSAVTAVPQSVDGASHAPKVSVEAARIRWGQPALAVDRHVRSMTPSPGAWTMIGDLRVKVGPVSVCGAELELGEQLEPGEVLARKDGFFIGTSTTAVKLEQIQPQGKKLMSAVDWARGARLDAKVLAQ